MERSDTIETTKLVGHLIRLGENTPANIALRNALQPAVGPRGRPPTTWISAMTKLFESMGITWRRAEEIAMDRSLWHDIIT